MNNCTKVVQKFGMKYDASVPVRKSQIRKFSWLIRKSRIIFKILQNTAQLCLKTVQNVVFIKRFFVLYFELKHSTIYF
jgi:hypothetical protein